MKKNAWKNLLVRNRVFKVRAWFLQWGHYKVRVFSFKRLTCSHHCALAGPSCSILCSDRSLLCPFLFSWSRPCRHAALPSVVDSASLVTSQKIRWPRGPSRRADEFLNISRCCCCDRLFLYEGCLPSCFKVEEFLFYYIISSLFKEKLIYCWSIPSFWYQGDKV